MILGCMDWIVLVIFGAFSILNQIYFCCSSVHSYRAIIIWGSLEEICGDFKTIISLQFEAKSFFFFVFSFYGVVPKVIFHVESKKYMYIMYKKCKIKHISDNVGENLTT
jgi:hypothetical protein